MHKHDHHHEQHDQHDSRRHQQQLAQQQLTQVTSSSALANQALYKNLGQVEQAEHLGEDPYQAPKFDRGEQTDDGTEKGADKFDKVESNANPNERAEILSEEAQPELLVQGQHKGPVTDSNQQSELSSEPALNLDLLRGNTSFQAAREKASVVNSQLLSLYLMWGHKVLSLKGKSFRLEGEVEQEHFVAGLLELGAVVGLALKVWNRAGLGLPPMSKVAAHLGGAKDLYEAAHQIAPAELREYHLTVRDLKRRYAPRSKEQEQEVVDDERNLTLVKE